MLWTSYIPLENMDYQVVISDTNFDDIVMVDTARHLCYIFFLLQLSRHLWGYIFTLCDHPIS